MMLLLLLLLLVFLLNVPAFHGWSMSSWNNIKAFSPTTVTATRTTTRSSPFDTVALHARRKQPPSFQADDSDDSDDDDDYEYYYDYQEEDEQRTARPSPSSSSPQPPPLDLQVDMDAISNDSSDTAASASGVYYNVYFDSLHSQEELQLDWEQAPDRFDNAGESGGGALVLLPPPSVSCPTCVIHFCGGTFFGSYSPNLWYKTLLEGLVRATNCCIVLTPIPIMFDKVFSGSDEVRTRTTNPLLHHVRMARRVQRQFQNAYVDVVLDEYGSSRSTSTTETTIQQVPIVGMGHSLGARLLTVLETLDADRKTQNDEDGTFLPQPYSAHVLMGFTNYGSAASIPGIRSLLNQSRQVERRKQQRQEQEEDQYEPVFVNSEESTPRNGRRRQSRKQHEYDDYDDDEEDEEWEELLEEFQQTLQQQADRLKTALTPRSKELEFYPSPIQLWKALKDDGRYTVPETLLVQFEDDTIDQSPRLADCLLQGNRKNGDSTNIKYARLKGTHLTPVSAAMMSSSNESADGITNGGWLELPSKATRALWKLVRGKQTRDSSEELRDLRQSIARYIIDVVAVKQQR